MTQKSYRQNLLIGILIIAVIISSQIIDLLSVSNYAAQLRLDFFAMPYIYALGWTIVLRQKQKIWKNLALILMMVAVYYAGLQAFRDQKVKYFDKQREMKVFDDIRARIKADPKFDPHQKYDLILAGCVDNTAYDHFNNVYKWEDAWTPFVMSWNAYEFFNFYEKSPFVNIPHFYILGNLTDDVVQQMDIDFLLYRARLWPHPNSVYIDGKYIYIILDWLSLYTIREKLHELGYGKTKQIEAKK